MQHRRFVEFATREQADEAKCKLSAKVIDDRAIRVDWMETTATAIECFHSRTLFIDRLPKTFHNIEAIKL